MNQLPAALVHLDSLLLLALGVAHEVVLEHAHQDGGEEAREEKDGHDRVED